MEKAKQLLELTREESDAVEKLDGRPNSAGDSCFYIFFGIRVNRVDQGSSFVLSRSPRASRAVIYDEPPPTLVSVDISIAYLSTADVDDELEITSRLLGQKERYNGASVIIKNKNDWRNCCRRKALVLQNTIQNVSESREIHLNTDFLIHHSWQTYNHIQNFY